MPRDPASDARWTQPAVIAAAVLAVIVALVMARCSRNERAADRTRAPVADAAMTAAPSAAPSQASVPIDAAAQARRTRAVTDAIGVVHAYLQAAGARDFEKADAFWQPNRHPSSLDEAGLRDLGPLRALRIQNLAPELPAGNETPSSLEIPVQLVANPEGGGAVRLNGHYRVRRDPVRARWEIAGASLQPVIR